MKFANTRLYHHLDFDYSIQFSPQELQDLWEVSTTTLSNSRLNEIDTVSTGYLASSEFIEGIYDHNPQFLSRIFKLFDKDHQTMMLKLLNSKPEIQAIEIINELFKTAEITDYQLIEFIESIASKCSNTRTCKLISIFVLQILKTKKLQNLNLKPFCLEYSCKESLELYRSLI